MVYIPLVLSFAKFQLLFMSKGGKRPARQTEKRRFYSFLPPAAELKFTKETAISTNKCNGEAGERVDLDLKL